MESKFSGLLSRFESYIDGAEGSQVNNEMLDRFESLVERLEKVHYASSSQPAGATTATAAAAGSAGGASAYLQKFKDSCFGNIPALLEVTKEQGNEHLLAATNHYLELLNSQEAVLKTMAECKKPPSMAFMAASTAAPSSSRRYTSPSRLTVQRLHKCFLVSDFSPFAFGRATAGL